MNRRLLALALATLALAGPLATGALAFVVSGRFLYEDRRYDGQGYTGAAQELPIRRARVEVVNAVTQQTLATGATDGDGRYALSVTGQTLPLNLYVRCATDGRSHAPAYQIRVVDNFFRVPAVGLDLTASMLYAITTDVTVAHDPASDLDAGTFVTRDLDGTGVAQAFNIFDNGVDFFDWMARPGLLGRLPDATEFIVFGWKATGTPGNPPPAFGSNYSQQGVFIGASPGEDTDGWSDTVILHETGHWLDDVFLASDNPGGAHFIGDNDANVLLAYGEGAATYHCAKVRELRALTRVNLLAQPVDDLVSLYADLLIPPPLGTPGALSFSYDFETGTFANTGAPIGQIGSANETNVTSALWDLLDGPGTPDATPGSDDDPVEVGDQVAWDIERNYLHTLPPAEYVTVEDYYQGWFARNGAGYLQSGLDHIFVTLAGMPFAADAFEPDDTPAAAHTIVPLPHALAAGRVVINEIELGAADAVELYNGSPDVVELGGWQLQVYANSADAGAPQIYTFPPFTLNPGEVAVLHEGGLPTANGRIHLYAGDRQVFNAAWNHGIDGAVVLRNGQGQAVDFVRWRGLDANQQPYENNTPVPAGVAYSGTLDTPLAPQTIARDLHGTDSDDAADFQGHDGSLGAANHPAPETHTIFAVGDRDVFAFVATAGSRYGFEAQGPYSASDPRIEIVSAAGEPLGGNDDADTPVRDARLDFYAAAAGTYYLRVSHTGPFTDWAEYRLLAFVRPVSAAFAPPGGMTATAANAQDTGDAVELQWVNAAAYDSVRVYRDGERLAALPGTPGAYTDHADRGLHRYEVAGVLAGAETGRASDHEFAGVVRCHAEDDFESGSAADWIRDGGSWDVTPFAHSGAFGFTDSPAGTYQGCPPEVSECPHNAVAMFAVPSVPVSGATLRWDQICVTEHCEPTPCDVCIVEVSGDGGTTWTEIARYDQASDPAWADNVADPTDWRPAEASLAAVAGQQALIRFRLQSDQLLELDGWYVDNVRVGDASCELVSAGDPARPAALEFLPAWPNPARGPTRLSWTLPAPEERVDLAIHDVSGRLVRLERLGPQAAGVHGWSWDGRDARGRTTPAGAYFVRLLAGRHTLHRRLVRLAP